MAWAERLRSGKWRGGYRIPGGEKRYTPETYVRERDAVRHANALEQESRSLGWRDPRAAARPWGEWADQWFETRPVERSTQKAAQYVLPKLIKKWGDTAIHDITRYAVKAWAAELLAEGRSHGTVLKFLSLLSASLTDAADAGIIPANPALGLKLGLVPGENERTLFRDEQHRLFQALGPQPGCTAREHELALRDQALCAVLLGSGPRWGEAVALGAFHFGHCEIRYRRAWDNENRVMKEYTKGKKRRSVPLAPWLDAITLPAREAHPTGLLFADTTGQPLNRQNWMNRRWKPALERARLNQGEHSDQVTIHTLRHTYATEQLEDGRTIGEIADLLGHASMAMAMKYAHRRSAVNPAAATAIADPRIAPPEETPLPPNVIPFKRRG